MDVPSVLLTVLKYASNKCAIVITIKYAVAGHVGTIIVISI